MSILGAHMSIAGGYYKAVNIAADAGCDCVQVFTKNNNQWRAKALTEEDCDKFKAAMAERGISHPTSHSSYLINMASPNEELRLKSVDAFVVELRRAEALGIPGVVMHPGSFTTSSEEEGIAKICQSLDEVHKQLPDCTTQCLLENTAGQGSNLGWDFQQLAAIIAGVAEPERLGICFDTCHAFAAGYPLLTPDEYKKTMQQLDKAVGIKRVKAFHLNDSKQPFGSRKDRHEGIGRGHIGLEAFANLLNDKRFKKVPMYLETPKGKDGDDEEGEELDVINLRTLRGLISS